MTGTITLLRSVGPEELELIRRSGLRAFPPRLAEQPIFYPVLSEEYALKIARDWNVRASGAVEVLTEFLAAYEVQAVGELAHPKYRIPAPELDAFNASIVGLIEIVAAFGRAEGGA